MIMSMGGVAGNRVWGTPRLRKTTGFQGFADCHLRRSAVLLMGLLIPASW